MADQVTNYQCPNCMGGLRFDTASGLLVCDHCNNSFTIALVEQLFADKTQSAATAGAEPIWDVNLSNNFSVEEAANMRGYICPSCAAEIICEHTTAATSCPYCGNPTVVPGQLSAGLRPDYILPFMLEKTAAVDALKNFYKKKRFLDKSFSDDNHIEEIKGVYAPFWLFDASTNAYMRFSATKVRSYTQGSYQVTETDHYRITRAGDVAFRMVPVDASSKMPDAHMDSIEPYNYSDLRYFSMGYLPGFFADKYDEDALFCSKRANERIKNSTEQVMMNTLSGYSSITLEQSNISLNEGAIKYALMPVWLLSTRWKDNVYLFTMNGQTGKLIGDLPVSWPMYFRRFFTIAGSIIAAVAAILYLIF